MFKVIEMAVTPTRYTAYVQGQRSRSQRKVMYQQQKRYNTAVQLLQSWHGVVIKVEKDWRGVGPPPVAMRSELTRFLVF